MIAYGIAIERIRDLDCKPPTSVVMTARRPIGLRGFSGHGFDFLSVSPRQQPVDVAVWMTVDDPGEDVGQIPERVDVIQLTGLDQ